jgi:hypothetical protein
VTPSAAVANAACAFLQNGSVTAFNGNDGTTAARTELLDIRSWFLGGNTVAGDGDGSDPSDLGNGTTCGGYTINGSNLEAQIIADAGRNISTSTSSGLANPRGLYPDFSPVGVTTTPFATPVGDGFFDAAGGSFVGAVAPSSTPWYAGWAFSRRASCIVPGVGTLIACQEGEF